MTITSATFTLIACYPNTSTPSQDKANKNMSNHHQRTCAMISGDKIATPRKINILGYT